MARAAVFLDRDGVLMHDVEIVTRKEDVQLYPYAAGAARRLRDAGFVLVVVTNQPVVARGLCSEADVDAVHAFIQEKLGGVIDRYSFCPHHPKATLEAYRAICECRKPRAGMLRDAAKSLHIDLARSFMVGDRPSDIAAGRRAGCRTVLVETGKHVSPPIESPDRPVSLVPDWTCANLEEAAEWILSR